MNSSSWTAPGAHFRSVHHPLFRSRVCSHFLSPLLYHYRPRTVSNGKSAKFLLMASCGMHVAMEIGVSCDRVSRFYRYLWHAGYDVWKRMHVQRHGGTISPLHRSERVPGALDDFVSEFGFGRRQPRDSGATNLLSGSLIKARCRLVSWE